MKDCLHGPCHSLLLSGTICMSEGNAVDYPIEQRILACACAKTFFISHAIPSE